MYLVYICTWRIYVPGVYIYVPGVYIYVPGVYIYVPGVYISTRRARRDAAMHVNPNANRPRNITLPRVTPLCEDPSQNQLACIQTLQRAPAHGMGAPVRAATQPQRSSPAGTGARLIYLPLHIAASPCCTARSTARPMPQHGSRPLHSSSFVRRRCKPASVPQSGTTPGPVKCLCVPQQPSRGAGAARATIRTTPDRSAAQPPPQQGLTHRASCTRAHPFTDGRQRSISRSCRKWGPSWFYVTLTGCRHR